MMRAKRQRLRDALRSWRLAVVTAALAGGTDVLATHAQYDTVNARSSPGFVKLTTASYGLGLYLDNSTGKIGVGTTSPGQKLTVGISSNTNVPAWVTAKIQDNLLVNDANGNGSVLGSDTSGAHLWGYNYATSGPKKLMLNEYGGNVGIGCTPVGEGRLQVRGTSFTPLTRPGGILYLEDNSALAADIGGSITFGSVYNGVGGYTDGAAIRMGKDNATSGQYGYYLAFHTRTNGSSNVDERMRITSAGYVGIGPGAPAYPLHLTYPLNTQINVNSPGASRPFSQMQFSSDAGRDYCIGVGNQSAMFGVPGKFYVYDKQCMAMRFVIDANGNVGIGVTNPSSSNLLDVNGNTTINGKLTAKEVRVTTTAMIWPDFVFSKNHKRETLKETEQFIAKNSHLPGIPSAKEIKEQGADLLQLQAKMLERIELLTLQVIDQNKKIENLCAQNTALKAEVAKIREGSARQ